MQRSRQLASNCTRNVKRYQWIALVLLSSVDQLRLGLCRRTTKHRHRTPRDTTLRRTLLDAHRSTALKHHSTTAPGPRTTEERRRLTTDHGRPVRAARGIQPSPILRLDRTTTKITTTIRIHRRRIVRPPPARLSTGRIRLKGRTLHIRQELRTVRIILIHRINRVLAQLDIKLHPVRLDTLRHLVPVKLRSIHHPEWHPAIHRLRR